MSALSNIPTIDTDRCACGAFRLSARKPYEKEGFTHKPDQCEPLVGSCAFSCPGCRQSYLITGDTHIARARALRDWEGCECTKTTPEAADGEAAASGAPDPGANRRSPVAQSLPATVETRGSRLAPVLHRALSGVPAHVRRRIAVT